ALMTLKEYLEDYAAPETRALGEALIREECPLIPNEAVRAQVLAHLTELSSGARDFRF
ncbi:MAG: [FeFe] hydrogenase H-cluster radical SAM maturase HydG, partial [Clostridia bacterium]